MRLKEAYLDKERSICVLPLRNKLGEIPGNPAAGTPFMNVFMPATLGLPGLVLPAKEVRIVPVCAQNLRKMLLVGIKVVGKAVVS